MYYVLAAAFAWSAVGIVACAGFRRAGHNFWLYAGLAVWMGPFILLVMRLVARDQEPSVIQVLRSGSDLDGWVDVLVGIDGSPESSASVTAALRTLLPAIRRIRFVAVLDHETAGSPDFFETDENLASELRRTADDLALINAELALLSGRADKALIAHACAEGFDLLLVAHRSNSAMSMLLGSTVQRLSRHAQLAVLVGPSASGRGALEHEPSATAAIGD